MRPRREGHARHVTALIELLAWWCVAVGIWIASLSAYSGHDLEVAAGCAVPCAAAAVVARRVIAGAWRPPADLLRWAALLPVANAVDAVRVLGWPLRRGAGGGEFRTVDVHAPGEDAAAAGRRAAAAFVLSSTPGSYVVLADENRGTLLIHALGGAPSALEREVGR